MFSLANVLPFQGHFLLVTVSLNRLSEVKSEQAYRNAALALKFKINLLLSNTLLHII